jgi:hypothetical protein
MPHDPYLCNLGFADEVFPAGVHICQIFNSDQERQEALLGFLESGIEDGEKTACFTEKLADEFFSVYLAERGHSLEELQSSGALTKSGTSEVYFQDGRFDPDRMLARLRQFYADSVAYGYPAARVIGEMTADVQHISGGSRLMEYESRVSMLQRECPVTTVCQYDAEAFDGATLMQILKVHPLMVMHGSVVHNPFYVQPEEYLAQQRKN